MAMHQSPGNVNLVDNLTSNNYFSVAESWSDGTVLRDTVARLGHGSNDTLICPNFEY